MLTITFTLQDEGLNTTHTLTAEQVTKVVELADKLDKSIEDTLSQIVTRGHYDVNYRHDRNVREYNAYKEWKKANKASK